LANWYRKFLVFGFVILATACSEDSEIKLQVWPQCPDVFGEKTFRFYGDNPQEIKETLSLQRYVSTLTALSRDEPFGPREKLGDMDIIFAPITIAPSANCDGLVLEKLMLVGAKVSDEELEAAVILNEGMPYSYAPQICSAQNMIWMKELGYTHRDITRLKNGRITNDFTFDLDQCKRWMEIEAFKPDIDQSNDAEGEIEPISIERPPLELLNLEKRLSDGLDNPVLLKEVFNSNFATNTPEQKTAMLDEVSSRCSAVQVTNLMLFPGDEGAFDRMGKFINFKSEKIFKVLGISDRDASMASIADHEAAVRWYQDSLVDDSFVDQDKLFCEKLLVIISNQLEQA
jgi:hypothetical protein